MKLNDLGRLKNRICTSDIGKLPNRNADIDIQKDELFEGNSKISIWVEEQIIRMDNCIHSFKMGLPHHRDAQEDVSIYFKDEQSTGGKPFFCGYPEIRPIIIKWLDNL